MLIGVSPIPAVRLPSKSMRLFCVCEAIWVWNHRSRSVVMRVCMLMRLGGLEDLKKSAGPPLVSDMIQI